MKNDDNELREGGVAFNIVENCIAIRIFIHFHSIMAVFTTIEWGIGNKADLIIGRLRT